MAERYGSLTLQLKNLSDLSNIGGTYTNVLINASGSQKLNSIGRGSFSFARHATLYAACIANVGQVAYVYVTDQVASGAAMDVATFVIEKVTTNLTINGMVTTVDGPSIEEELTYSTLDDDTIDDGAGGRDTSSIASIMAYANSGWTHNGTETVKGTYHVSRGDPVFKVLVDAAKQSGEFFRLSSYSAPAKQINWYNAADSSGITLRMPTDPTTYDGSTTVGIIEDMSLSEDFAPTLSGIRPFMSGLEDGRGTVADIAVGDREADPAGYTTNYTTYTIVNNTLETALGYEKHEDVDFSHIKVEDPTNPAHVSTAGLALWDEAIYYLQQRDSTRKYYDVVCIVPYDLRPGQTVTIVYSEYEGGTSGGTQILNINTTFKVLSVDNSFGVSTKGKRVTKLVVSDDIVTRPEAVHYIRAAMEKTQATTRKTNVLTSPGSVSTSRTLSATAPLLIDGGASADLSANRTYSINGLTTVGAANQIPGTNAGGTAWEYKTLTNGTGISITHGVNTITITNSDPATGKAANSEAFLTIGNTAGLSAERALTAGDGIDLTDAGANSTATIAVDVTDIIDTAAGITETTNNIQVNLDASGGLEFNSGATRVKLPTNHGLSRSSSGLALGTPGSVTASSTNAVTTTTHTHAADSTIAKTTDLHNQVHSITGSDHTITASQYQLVGATATNTLGLLTPSADTTTATILRSDSNGRLGLQGLGINAASDGDYLLITTDTVHPCIVANAGTAGEIATEDGGAIRIGHWNAGTSTFTERIHMDASGRLGINATTLTYGMHIKQGDNSLLLDHTSATGNPVLGFAQSGTRRSYIQHNDTSDNLILNSEYGIITLTTVSGVVVGSPTGGAKGSGTINAQAVYDDNVLLTDFVFEPDYHLLSIDTVRSHYELHKHLPTIPGRKEWEKSGRFSLGKIVSHIWETVEVQQIYITQLHDRITRLENGNA